MCVCARLSRYARHVYTGTSLLKPASNPCWISPLLPMSKASVLYSRTRPSRRAPLLILMARLWVKAFSVASKSRATLSCMYNGAIRHLPCALPHAGRWGRVLIYSRICFMHTSPSWIRLRFYLWHTLLGISNSDTHNSKAQAAAATDRHRQTDRHTHTEQYRRSHLAHRSSSSKGG